MAAGTDPTTGRPFADDVRAIFDAFLGGNVPTEGEVFLTIVNGRPFVRPRGPCYVPNGRPGPHAVLKTLRTAVIVIARYGATGLQQGKRSGRAGC